MAPASDGATLTRRGAAAERPATDEAELRAAALRGCCLRLQSRGEPTGVRQPKPNARPRAAANGAPAPPLAPISPAVAERLLGAEGGLVDGEPITSPDVQEKLRTLLEDRRQQILDGNPYTLNSIGQLSLPTLPPITLWGLTEKEASALLECRSGARGTDVQGVPPSRRRYRDDGTQALRLRPVHQRAIELRRAGRSAGAYRLHRGSRGTRSISSSMAVTPAITRSRWIGTGTSTSRALVPWRSPASDMTRSKVGSSSGSNGDDRGPGERHHGGAAHDPHLRHRRCQLPQLLSGQQPLDRHQRVCTRPEASPRSAR